MAYGITMQGFIIKRLPEIKAECEQLVKDTMGDVDVNPSEILGQIIGIFSKFHTDIWELGEMTYLSQYPASAEGISLDNVVSYNGLTRFAQTKTRVSAIMTGDEGTVVPSGSRFKTTDYANTFTSLTNATITKNGLSRITFNLLSDTNVDYSVRINGFNIAISDTSYIKAQILFLLATAINNHAGINQYVFAESLIGVPDDYLKITAKGQSTIFSVVVGDGLVVEKITSPVQCESDDYGAVLCSAGTLTEIVTGITGLDTINNLWDGALGRLNETDAELRARREQSLLSGGAATIEAIRTQIEQTVMGVSTVIVYENDTDVTDSELRPPHSIEALVDGGDVDAIAKAIFDTKSAGITTHRNATSGVTAIITDSQGYTHAINFSRPRLRYGWVKVVYERYYEEALPNDAMKRIMDSIKAYGDTLKIGENMLRQRFYAPIYSAVTGVKSATIYIDITDHAGDSPTWQNVDELPVNGTTRVVFINDTTHILIQEA